jgi:threonine/homoserine/homoserine lactone efflux protein
MILDILKGFVIGATAAMPVGPIAILVIQKTMGKGRQAGFVTGLGASVVDTLYAIIALFALAFAQSLIEKHENLILLAGGCILTLIGVSMALSNPFRKKPKNDGRSNVSSKDFLQALAMGISNPMAVFVMFALFAFFGIANKSPHDWSVMPIILSVSAGSVTYWFSISWMLSRFRQKFQMNTILWISRVTGALIVIIGTALLGKGLFMVLLQGVPIQ